MSLDIYYQGRLIGSVVRSAPGYCYAYDANGLALGTYADLDGAAAALVRKAAA